MKDEIARAHLSGLPADIRNRLLQLYSKSSSEAYQSAFRRIERLTGRRLSQIPADVVEWERLAAKIVWAGDFTRARTPEARQRAFDGFVGRVSAGIRQTHERATPRTGVACPAAEAAWERVAQYVADAKNRFDAEGRAFLPNMASLSIANLRARLGAALRRISHRRRRRGAGPDPPGQGRELPVLDPVLQPVDRGVRPAFCHRPALPHETDRTAAYAARSGDGLDPLHGRIPGRSRSGDFAGSPGAAAP